MSTNVDEYDDEQRSAMTRNTVSAIAGWLGLILLLATVAYWAVTAQFDTPAKILLIAAFLALTAYVWLNPEAIAAVVTGRGTRTILTTAIFIVLGIALVVAINWLYGLVAPRLGTFGRADLTAGQSLTLSDQSIKAVQQLPEGTQAIGLFQSDATGISQQRTAENLMKEYSKYNPNLSVQWVDIDRNPTAVSYYGITSPNVMVFVNGEKYQVSTALTEEGFSGAILKLESGGDKSVAILNTASLLSFGTSSGQNALAASLARSALTGDNYNVLPAINPVVSPTISLDDVDVLIVPPAPVEQPLSDAAVHLITDYLDKGGHVLLIGDPQAAPLPTAILSKYGLVEPGHIVVETNSANSFGSSPYNVVVQNYPSSNITTDFSGKPSIYYVAGVIQPPTSTITGFLVSPLVNSSSSAVPYTLPTDPTGQTPPAQVPGSEPGTLTMAVTVEGVAATTATTDTNVTRLVVIDDMDWVSDSFLQYTDTVNRDLFLNSVNWLSNNEERISTRPQDTTSREMFLDNASKNAIAWITIVFLPLLALAGGGVVWWRRR